MPFGDQHSQQAAMDQRLAHPGADTPRTDVMALLDSVEALGAEPEELLDMLDEGEGGPLGAILTTPLAAHIVFCYATTTIATTKEITQ